MIISYVTVSNLFSYQESKISFGRYNVITGINGAGKSNLIRILKIIVASHSYGFSTSYLEDHEKFDQNEGSSIRIGIKFSQTESCLISRFIFRNTKGKFQNGEFILSWDGRRSNQKIKCALILENKLII
jgi:AAA15 family ATPase/GTPase